MNEDEQKALEELQNALMPSAEELAVVDETVGILVLVTGEKEGGKPFYAYISVDPSKYMAFQEAQKEGDYKLTDYGEVLAYGEEAQPPQKVVQEMEETYGANSNFEADLAQAVEEEFTEQKTRDRIFDKFGVQKKDDDIT